MKAKNGIGTGGQMGLYEKWALELSKHTSVVQQGGTLTETQVKNQVNKMKKKYKRIREYVTCMYSCIGNCILTHVPSMQLQGS